MFDHWHEFYLMAGGAAAVLIGLIFVVISLTQDRSRSAVLAGSRLYMGPIVLGASFVLVLSAGALTPGIGRGVVAALVAIVAAWGLARGLVSVVGIARRPEVHWTDVWFYGVIPSGLYLTLGAVAWGLFDGDDWANPGLAAIVTAMLVLTIRNEWDLITWIVPRQEGGEGD